MKKRIILSVAVLFMVASTPFVFKAYANPTGGCVHNNPGKCDYGDDVVFDGYMIPEKEQLSLV